MDSKTLFENPILRVVKRVATIAGKTVSRTLIEMDPAVMIVAIDKDGMVRFVGEYMASSEYHQNTFAKGKVDKGELPIYAAVRELREELGLEGDLEHLMSVENQPSHSTAVTHIYVARNCTPTRKFGGDEEDGTLVPRAAPYADMTQRPHAYFKCVRCLAALQELRIRDLEYQLAN